VAAELGVDRVTVVAGHRPDGRREVAHAVARTGHLDRRLQRLLGRADDPQVLLGGGPDDDRTRRVGHPAVDADREVRAEDVAVAQRVVVGEAVQDGVVDR
jgi:hypothetical protein